MTHPTHDAFRAGGDIAGPPGLDAWRSAHPHASALAWSCWSSPHALATAIDYPCPAWDDNRKTGDGSRVAWCGGTWKETLQRLRDGHEPSTRAVQRALAKIPAFSPTLHRRATVRRDVAGSRVDVARWIAGDPVSMRRRAPARPEGLAINLALLPVMAASCPPSAVSEHAAALAAIAWRVQAAGYGLTLWLGMHTYNSGRDAIALVRLAHPASPIDLPALAAACSVYGYRRLLFSALGCDPRAEFLGCSLGRCIERGDDRRIQHDPARSSWWLYPRSATRADRLADTLAHLRDAGLPGIPAATEEAAA